MMQQMLVGLGAAGGLGSSAGNAATSAKAILAADPSASSGAYWISVQGVATHLYCDMTTDGGGFMLCGKYNATGGSNTGSNGVSNLNNLTASLPKQCSFCSSESPIEL